MSEQFFPNIEKIKYEGENSKNPFAFRYYDENRVVMGKTMKEHLRFAACYWHNFCSTGFDIFGEGTFDRPWLQPVGDQLALAEQKAKVAFEFFEKLGVPYFCFHDTDIAPEGKTLKESHANVNHIADILEKEMQRTGVKLLWGTANLFSNKRFCAGGATNPNPEVFAYGAAQVKHAMEVTNRLGGQNYVLWGGREGYDSLLNTDLKQESEQYARFLKMVVEHKHKIGFKGTLLIEPKPQEPTKHQYDYDTATVAGFLHKHGLENEIKVNIEANHATLAGHSFHHEVAVACAEGIMGSIDANRGDMQNGWDTDQYPNDVAECTLVMYEILKAGGFTTGGLNFDTKLRRQSCEREDLFHGHIGGMDTMAKSLLNAAQLIEEAPLSSFVEQRYAGWKQGLGKDIFDGQHSLESLSKLVLEKNINPTSVSGRQELLENVVNRYI
ncbi:xylose isomerase [Shewanella livingstonensis]|uniref:Xylose isomerase n=1 Tax=Shewanella livingstonensis TaxID=150120 RepID=A0A3G8LUU3_9GAMM|nr:xylose isomerase [Shewanella livingstonensis]AZG73257.1 xylose isomerase [Shewanella livingstonensis]